MMEGTISGKNPQTQASLKRILYVEDEPDIQMVVQFALKGAGLVLEMCDSGKEALEKAPRFAADLILLDVMMPGMDGPATLKELRKIPQTSATPVVFMTAKIQKNEIDEYKKLGVLEVISKPFDPLTLSEALQKIWEVNAQNLGC